MTHAHGSNDQSASDSEVSASQRPCWTSVNFMPPGDRWAVLTRRGKPMTPGSVGPCAALWHCRCGGWFTAQSHLLQKIQRTFGRRLDLSPLPPRKWIWTTPRLCRRGRWHSHDKRCAKQLGWHSRDWHSRRRRRLGNESGPQHECATPSSACTALHIEEEKAVCLSESIDAPGV